MRCFLIILFIAASGLTVNTSAQENLVANPSFEEYNRLPQHTGDARSCLKSWSVPANKGNTDYFHLNSLNSAATTESNRFGGETPHSGSAYAGFCITDTYREFIGTTLTHPLEKGKKYVIRMFISKGDSAGLCDLHEISVLFLSKFRVIMFDEPMPLPPQIVFHNDSGFTQTKGWTELSTVYTADGTESWMCIGPHQWKCDTAWRKSDTPLGCARHQAHYYIDDISVTEFQPLVSSLTLDGTGADPPHDAFEPLAIYTTTAVRFAANGAMLSDTDQVTLNRVAEYLRLHPELNLEIRGHTDSVGTKSGNYDLSVARGDAVKNYFINQGISPIRVRSRGFGESLPADSNETEEGRARNRRVEFIFTKRN